MKYLQYIMTLVFAVLIVNCCQGQSKQDDADIPPKVKVIFDSLYSGARNIRWEDRTTDGTIKRVSFDCDNCKEGFHQSITFDTNGNILDKDIQISKNDLPGNIINYIESNYPNGFEYSNVTKIYTNSGEVSYRVEMRQGTPDGNATSGSWVYVLKFNSGGDYLSVEKKPQSN